MTTILVFRNSTHFESKLQLFQSATGIDWSYDNVMEFWPSTLLSTKNKVEILSYLRMFILLRGPFSWFDNTLACHFGIILFFKWINCIRQMFFIFFNLTQHMFLMIPNIIFCFNIYASIFWQPRFSFIGNIYHQIFDRPRLNWSVTFFKKLQRKIFIHLKNKITSKRTTKV